MKSTLKPWQAIICGIGGQGVLFVNRMLALGAGLIGLPVLVSEVHGMAQRGGSVVSHLKAGSYASPLVSLGQADLVFCLEKGEAIRNLPYLAYKGKLVVNAPSLDFLSDEAKKALHSHKIDVYCKSVDQLSLEVNRPVNLLLLAAAAKADFLPIKEAVIKKALAKTMPSNHAQFETAWQAV